MSEIEQEQTIETILLSYDSLRAIICISVIKILCVTTLEVHVMPVMYQSS